MHILNLQDAYPEMRRKKTVLSQNRTAGYKKQARNAYPENSGYTSSHFAEYNGYMTLEVPNACPERYVSNFTKLIFIGHASKFWDMHQICWLGI